MAKPVTLSNGRSWKSKKDATAHFREMLNRYSDDDVVVDGGDHDDLLALLERFDALVSDTAPKGGPGVDHFERRLNRGDGWASPGFWVVRTDGSQTDFSYIKAIEGVPKPRSQEFYDACHNAVSRDLSRFKQLQFAQNSNSSGLVECDISGEMITFAQAHLSHAEPSFAAIVHAFRMQKGWVEDIPDDALTLSADKQLSSHFVRDSDAEEFRRLHHQTAILRIVSKSRPAGVRSVSPVRRPLRIDI